MLNETTTEPVSIGQEPASQGNKQVSKPIWETPTLEDVSEQVMAQPYIRFT